MVHDIDSITAQLRSLASEGKLILSQVTEYERTQEIAVQGYFGEGYTPAITVPSKDFEIAAQWWGTEPGAAISPRELYTVLTKNIPNAKIEIQLYPRDEEAIYPYSIKVHGKNIKDCSFQLYYPNPEEPIIGGINVEVDRNAQGKGIAKTLIGNVLQFARAFKINEIHGRTHEIGGYNWVKAGFIPTQETWDNGLQSSIQGRLDNIRATNGNELPVALKRQVEQILNSPDPKAIWALSELTYKVRTPRSIKNIVYDNEKETIKLGKALLIGQLWDAVLKLDNVEAVKRIETYIASSPHVEKEENKKPRKPPAK